MSSMDRRWRIKGPGGTRDQMGRRLEIEGGALVFTDGIGRLTVAVSPSAWTTVEEIEPPEEEDAEPEGYLPGGTGLGGAARPASEPLGRGESLGGVPGGVPPFEYGTAAYRGPETEGEGEGEELARLRFTVARLRALVTEHPAGEVPVVELDQLALLLGPEAAGDGAAHRLVGRDVCSCGDRAPLGTSRQRWWDRHLAERGIAAVTVPLAALRVVDRLMDAILIRCREGDKRSDWLPVIDGLASEAREKLAEALGVAGL